MKRSRLRPRPRHVRYVNGNPLNYNDPNGHRPCEEDVCGGYNTFTNPAVERTINDEASQPVPTQRDWLRAAALSAYVNGPAPEPAPHGILYNVLNVASIVIPPVASVLGDASCAVGGELAGTCEEGLASTTEEISGLVAKEASSGAGKEAEVATSEASAVSSQARAAQTGTAELGEPQGAAAAADEAPLARSGAEDVSAAASTGARDAPVEYTQPGERFVRVGNGPQNLRWTFETPGGTTAGTYAFPESTFEEIGLDPAALKNFGDLPGEPPSVYRILEPPGGTPIQRGIVPGGEFGGEGGVPEVFFPEGF